MPEPTTSDPSDETAEELPPLAASPSNGNGRPTVVVVEDDATTRQILRVTLETRGFNVVTASHAGEALRIIGESHPVLVTLDVVMPGGTGFEVLRAMRADAHAKNIPVVLLSVLADETGGKQALKLGANAVLSKPCDADALWRTVNNLVAREHRDVLLISEDIGEGERLKSSLSAQGFKVVEALDTGSALSFARQYPPDLILLQAAASNARTQALLEELRKSQPTAKIPVVLIADDTVSDRGAVYFGGWSDALRSDSASVTEILSTLVERFASRSTSSNGTSAAQPTA
jgi:DNA-binding response OmpR family regulator